MTSHHRKFTLPIVLATGLAALALSACGGGSDSGSDELAKYAPADAPVYLEGAVQPASDVAANVDAITEQIAGVNLGDQIKESINASGQVDFDTDIQPWLGENAAVFSQIDPAQLTGSSSEDLAAIESEASSSGDSFGLVVQITDTDAAQSFIDKQAEADGATDGEYEGFSYKISDSDGSAIGIVDDNLVVGSTEAEFEAAVDASKGDNLADTDAFGDLSGHVADGALVNVFTNNDPYLDSLKEAGYDLGGLYSALGIDLEGSGTVLSLVPETNEISMKGYTNAGSDLTSGDPSSLIETFPADSFFATGSGDVGPNATKIVDALNEEGIPGLLEPGQVDKFIKDASGQIDVQGIIESLETVAFFVNGENAQSLGGALVATSSNIGPIEDSLRGISSLIGMAGDSQVQPLPGGVAGFRVRTPELPGRPVVVGVKGDRMVIGIGTKASMNALTGSGASLADSDAYKAADESTEAAGLDMFANPLGIAALVANEGHGDPDASSAAKVLAKFKYMAAGSSSEEGTFEFNMGLGK